MSEKSALIARIVLGIIAYILFIVLAVYGNTLPGWKGLGVMMIGLAGILLMIYLYNRRHR